MSAERLLLVDDDSLRSMLDAALSHHGFDVTPVDNGRDALARVGMLGPDLVVLDVMMPEIGRLRVVPPPAGSRLAGAGAVLPLRHGAGRRLHHGVCRPVVG